MFELTEADLFRLVEMFTSSDATFMHVRVDDVDLVLSRNDQDGVRSDPDVGVPNPVGATVAPAGAAAGAAPVARTPGAPLEVEAAEPPPDAPAPAAPAGATAVDPALVSIDASSIGSFYRAPRPDLPPYVDVGSTVEADTTVGLIEAMKVFTGVTAGLHGTVVEALVEDGQFVEYGQPLFRVRPSGTESAAIV